MSNLDGFNQKSIKIPNSNLDLSHGRNNHFGSGLNSLGFGVSKDFNNGNARAYAHAHRNGGLIGFKFNF